MPVPVRAFLLAVFLLLPFSTGMAQRSETPRPDSLRKYEIAPIVVTATRAERTLQDVPVPTTVVTREAIVQQGAVRLSDLLAEQPGLFVVDGIGTGGLGVQVQGLDSDYTLILIDGEPVVGREAGTLDLDRLTVAGVERVEIVRGPTSSRFGSDALAGVINLITRRPADGLSGRASARVERFETTDLTLEAEAAGDRWGLRLLGNRYASEGYDLRPDEVGSTTPSFTDYAGHLRLDARPTDNLTLGLRAQTAQRDQQGAGTLGETMYDENGQRREWSVAPSVRYRLAPGVRAEVDGYAAGFDTYLATEDAATGAPLDETRFGQGYQKAEARVVATPGAAHILYVGGGVIRESVESDRYAAARSTRQGYVFAEYGWMPVRLFDLTVSARYDDHSEFGSRLTPKVALLARPSDALRLRAFVGSGFKTPDFRQRYLNFVNATAGYSLFGATEAPDRLAALDAMGGLEAYLVAPSTLGALAPETSTSYGVGVEAGPVRGVSVRVNTFYNAVRDLIETQPVAVLSGGQTVYSYFNLNRIFTRGLDADVSYAPGAGVLVGASYQFLDTADRDVLDQIDAGELFGRRAGRDVRLTRSDYGGLFGRSRHSATLRVRYAEPVTGITSALRFVWRGRYGYGDLNGNLVLDDEAEYVQGYGLVNATFTRAFGRVQVQTGVRNLLGHTDPARVPSLAGRIFFVGGSVRF